MSKTIVDMAKVTQMLDAGWAVKLYRGPMGSYEVRAVHPNSVMRGKVLRALVASAPPHHMVFPDCSLAETIEECHTDGDELMTDDFSPEQALTRMAYKIHGEII